MRRLNPNSPRLGKISRRRAAINFRVVREPGVMYDSRTSLSNPDETSAFLRTHNVIPDDAKEHFFILLLGSQNQLIGTHHVSTGSLSDSLVHPREVFGPALRVLGVNAIVLVHNHPSGDPTPSRADRRLTTRLIEAARLLSLTIHDHVIIGSGTEKFYSFAQEGTLQ